ncbi:hypothetical protein Poli38472_008204 [Pythium oligandrum]|uniref:Thioesterase n=1 Tax=Pythium oligandrum TaxID=41045 RepID=A0A8K1CND3_PYTOL|nr:hypothetical protein Poli38472_008204 [Pythium oligandrum]|eukprot:TMW65562.1 hypothetical protein Poli38472_008204 [Pythium oligandrum]
MVLRIFWNVGAGLVHRAINKNAIKPGMGVLYPAVWRGRPGMLDVDINMHLNNAAYLFNSDLARWHWVASSGMLFQALKQRQLFFVSSQTIRYRYPIPPLRPYEIRTEVSYMDDEWIYILHQFVCPTTGKLYAEALCRTTVKSGSARVAGRELIRATSGIDYEGPKEMPTVVDEFLKWDASSRVTIESEEEREKRLAATAKSTRRPQGLLGKITKTWNLPF